MNNVKKEMNQKKKQQSDEASKTVKNKETKIKETEVEETGKKMKISGFSRSQKIAISILSASVVVLIILIAINVFATEKEFQPLDVSSTESAVSSAMINPNEGEELDTSYDKTEFEIDLKKFEGTLLEETKKANQSYLDETVFVGDSNTGRLYGTNQIPLQNTVYYDGIGIQSVPGMPCIYFVGKEEGFTIPAAIGMMQPRRIILNFGTNNASPNTSAEEFIDTYLVSIRAIQASYPHSEILISSIAPLAKHRQYNNISIKKIDEFNFALMEMAQKEGYRFLNATEALKNSDTGYIKAEYVMEDGLHLSDKGAKAYIDYFMSHASDAPDKRPSKPKYVPQRRLAPKTEEDTEKDKAVAVSFLVETQDAEGNVLEDEVGGYLSTPEGATTQVITEGNSTSVMTANTNEGYTFIGWFRKDVRITEEASLAFTVSEEEEEPRVALTAVFRKKEVKPALYPLQYTAAEGGTLAGYSVDEAAQTTTCTAAADAGYEFIGWSDGVTNTTRTDAFQLQNALSVTAQFRKIEASADSDTEQPPVTPEPPVEPDGSGDTTTPDGSGDATQTPDGSGDATTPDGSGDATTPDGSGDATQTPDGSGDTTSTETEEPLEPEESTDETDSAGKSRAAEFSVI